MRGGSRDVRCERTSKRPRPGAERVRGRRGGDQLVVVPRAMALRRAFHLEQIGREHAPPVFPDRAVAEGVVIGRHRLHAGDGGLAVRLGRGHPEVGDGLQVVQRRTVAAGMVHAGQVVRRLGADAVGEGAGAVVQVPVEGLGQHQPLRGLQPQPVHVADEHQHRGQLHLLGQAELDRLLDAVDRVRPGIRQAEDLRAGCLRLQQERREVGRRRERIARLAEHLAAGFLDEAPGVARELLAEHVVGGDEIPAIAAGLRHRAAGGLGEHVGVVRPVHRVGRALRARQIRGAGARIEEHLVLLAHHGGDSQRHRGGRHVDDDVHPVPVEPLPGDGRADIRLVLVVGVDDFDREAVRAEILHRLPHAGDRGGAPRVAVRAGHVVQHSQLDAGLLGPAARQRQGGEGGAAEQRATADHACTIGQPPSLSGRNAWSIGVVATSL